MKSTTGVHPVLGVCIDVTEKDPVTQVMEKYNLNMHTISVLLGIPTSRLLMYQNGECFDNKMDLLRLYWALEPYTMLNLYNYDSNDLSPKERASLRMGLKMTLPKELAAVL